MIDPRHEELLHKQLDGEATPAETAELEGLLAARPELRARREQLVRLFGVLASTPIPEPTEELRERISNGVRALPVHRPREPWTILVARFLRPGWRQAAFFAAGVLAGVALLAAFSPRLALEDGVAGALLPSRREATARTVDEQELRWAGGSAVCRVRAAAGSLWAEIELRAEGTASVELRFDPAALLPTSAGCAPPGATVTLGTERVRIDNATRGSYRVAFSTRPAGADAIALSIQSGDSLVEARLRTQPQGRSPSS